MVAGGSPISSPALPGGITGSAGVSLSDHLQLMRENMQHQLELEKMRLGGPAKDYTLEAIGLLRALVQPTPASVGSSSIHKQEMPSSDEAEDDQPDAVDIYYNEEPEADDIMQRLVNLRRTNPSMYEQAKAMLKGM
jgi:hypothetical protein